MVSREFAELENWAHWLKGAAGFAGFQAFGAPASDLSEAIRERDLARIRLTLTRLEEMAKKARIISAPPS